MKTVLAVIVIETVDGVLTISCKFDRFGFLKAELSINQSRWNELFVDIEEFNEFVTSLPIVKFKEVIEYQVGVEMAAS